MTMRTNLILTIIKLVRKKFLDMKSINQINSSIRNALRLLKITGQAGQIQVSRFAICAVAKRISQKFVQGVFLSSTESIMEA